MSQTAQRFLVMQVHSLTGTQLGAPGLDPKDRYVVSYDPDGNDGHGDVVLPTDPAKAKRYTLDEARKEWDRTSTVRPLRSDGQPNKPLTAYTVALVHFEDAQQRSTP